MPSRQSGNYDNDESRQRKLLKLNRLEDAAQVARLDAAAVVLYGEFDACLRFGPAHGDRMAPASRASASRLVTTWPSPPDAGASWSRSVCRPVAASGSTL